MWRTLACLLFAACASTGAPPVRAVRLPVHEVQSLDGHAASLTAALGGSPGVIDLWATWCTACERERPKLERLQAAYAARGLRVIGLDVGEAPSVVSAYLAQKRISYPIYLDPEFRIADALGDQELPTILVVDKEGRITHRSTSLDQQTLAAVKSLLQGAPEN